MGAFYRPYVWMFLPGVALLPASIQLRDSILDTLGQLMHWFWIYLVWMVYAAMVMGILEAAADRTQNMRGAGTALVLGAIVGVVLSVTILWFGPTDPFAA